MSPRQASVTDIFSMSKTVKLWHYSSIYNYSFIKEAGFKYFPAEVWEPYFGRNNKLNLWDWSEDTPLWFRPIPHELFARRNSRLNAVDATTYLFSFRMNKSYVDGLAEIPVDGAGWLASIYRISETSIEEFNSNLVGDIELRKIYWKR